MQQKYLIRITGKMEIDGESDTVQLTTHGHFARRNGKYFISYMESEATGYEGSRTTVKVENGTKVSMVRSGKAPSQLVIECGKRHVCHYDTGYGAINLGVAADEIHNQLTDKGGDIRFSYILDSGTQQLSHNSVEIHVQEAQAEHEHI